MAARDGWTLELNRRFELALAVYDTDTPDRWNNVARYLGGCKSPDDCRRYYELLLDEVARIDAANLPLPA